MKYRKFFYQFQTKEAHVFSHDEIIIGQLKNGRCRDLFWRDQTRNTWNKFKTQDTFSVTTLRADRTDGWKTIELTALEIFIKML